MRPLYRAQERGLDTPSGKVESLQRSRKGCAKGSGNTSHFQTGKGWSEKVPGKVQSFQTTGKVHEKGRGKAVYFFFLERGLERSKSGKVTPELQ